MHPRSRRSGNNRLSLGNDRPSSRLDYILGLFNTRKTDDIRDLLAYLLFVGNPDDPMLK